MSPEQARGEALDERSDLFSFGAVLYEMATGKQAFSGPTSAVIFDAILRGDPASPGRLNPSLPAELERILNKALEKDRRLRYQSAGEMSVDLQRLKRDFDSGKSAPIAAQKSVSAGALTALSARRGWMWGIAAVSLLALAAIVAIIISDRRFGGADEVPRLTNAVKLTTALGVEDFPSWSPDGRALAYQSDQAGNWDIWVTQVGSSEAINRTADSSDFDGYPAWSPDGQWIAFFSSRDGGGYYVMPGVGGTARKVVSWPAKVLTTTTAQWSPDSSQLAYPQDQGTGPSIEILTLTSGASRRLSLPMRPRNNAVLDIRWSPDGRWLAYRRTGSEVAATAELWLTRVADGKTMQLTDGTKREWSPGWSADSRSLFFLSTRGGSSDLWRFILDRNGNPSGEPQQITAGAEMINAVFSADGKKLGYSKGRLVEMFSGLRSWRIVLQRGRTSNSSLLMRQISNRWMYLATDALFSVRTDPETGICGRCPPAAESCNKSPGILLWTPAPRWKPDGKELVFYSNRTGHRQIWIMPLDGGPARQLSKDEAETVYPSWSPNSLEIVAEGTPLQAFAVGNGQRRILLNENAHSPEWSPDGRSVLILLNRDGALGLWRIPATGGQPERLSKGEAAIGRWAPDGRQIYFVGWGAQANNIWQIALSNREERPLTALVGKRGQTGGAGLATDGKYLYFTWEESVGDIWAADIIPLH
jgi:Tol biopolymer transport system component